MQTAAGRRDRHSSSPSSAAHVMTSSTRDALHTWFPSGGCAIAIRQVVRVEREQKTDEVKGHGVTQGCGLLIRRAGESVERRGDEL